MNTSTSTPPKLIGIHGHAGAGKDSVANWLADHYSETYIHSFADPLKSACAALFGVTEDAFYTRDAKETIQPNWGVTPRMMAQFVGTELVREHMWKLLKADTEDFWIRRMEIELQQLNGYELDDIVIIPDVRFQNEYDWIIRNSGYVIHLTRPHTSGNIGIPSHKSEAGINFNTPERTFLIHNDDTLETLYSKADSIFRDICDKFFPQSL